MENYQLIFPKSVRAEEGLSEREGPSRSTVEHPSRRVSACGFNSPQGKRKY